MNIASPEDFVAWFVIIPLWTASIWRLPAAIMRPKSRVLWWVFTLLAVSMTTRIQAVGDALYAWTGTPDGATYVKHLVGVASVGGLVRWVVTVVPEREDGLPEPRYRRAITSRPRQITTWAVIVSMTLAFPFSNLRHYPAEDSTFIFAQAGHLWGSVHLLLFYSYLIFGMVCATMMCAAAGRRDHGMFGLGLRFMALGCAIGTLYGAIRSAYLVIRLFDRPFLGGDTLVDVGSNLSLVTCIALVLIGSAAPPIQRLQTALDQRAAISDLRPLWLTLTRPTPKVVLPREGRLYKLIRHQIDRLPMGANRSRAWLDAATDLLDWSDLNIRLHRRVTEILDGALELQQYVPGGFLRLQVEYAVRDLQLPAEAASAYLLRTAIEMKRQGGAPSDTQARMGILSATADIPSQVRTLLPVRRAMENRTMMQKIERHLAALNAARTSAPVT